MKLARPLAALAALVLCGGGIPLLAQTSSITIEAESMTLSSYAVEYGNRIKLTAGNGTAQAAFTGESGTYNMQVYVQPETDGQPTLEVYKGTTLLQKYTYPLSDTPTSFAINNVALNSGDTLKLVGTANADAWARVYRLVLTPVGASPAATSTP